MVTMLISFFVIVLSFNLFVISYQTNGINRLVLSAPLSLFETAIILYNIDDEVGPIFDKEILEDNIDSYFDFHISRYTSDYDISYYYYVISDGSLDMSNEPKAVEVLISAQLALSNSYEKTMYYEIRSA